LIRRGRFLIAAAAAAAALEPRSSAAQGLTAIRVAVVPSDDVTPLLYAQQSGLFRRAGLDVIINRATSGAAIAAAVVSGTYDVGLISLMATINGHARGLPFVMIAPSLMANSEAPDGLLITAKDSPVRSMRDLAGKLVSVTAIRGIDWVAVNAYAVQFGIDPETIKFVELPMSSVPAALEQHRVDAGTVTNPTLEKAMATGNFRSLGNPLDGIAKHWMIAAWSTTSDFLAKNRDTVDRFAGAMHAASDYAMAHNSETAPLIAAFTGVEPAVALTMKRSVYGEYLDPLLVQPAIDATARFKVIDKAFPAQELISPYALKPPR
jgi:NitT/TauT family transport system substrate-binding protein